MAKELTSELALTLAHNNLIGVFSERDPKKRREVIAKTYHSDVELYEPSEVSHGHDGVDEKAGGLLKERDGWIFEPQGNVKRNHNMLYLAWGFGPPGENGKVDVKGTGADIIQVEGDKIKRFWVIIDGVTDVKA